MRNRKSIRLYKFLTLLMATFTVYFAIFAIPTFPFGFENTWEGSNIHTLYAIVLIIFLVTIFSLMIYLSRKEKGWRSSLATEPEAVEKFIENFKEKKEKNTWAAAFMGFLFLGLGFVGAGFDWHNPIYLVCFGMGTLMLVFAVWYQYDSYVTFLKKIEPIIPYLHRFVAGRK